MSKSNLELNKIFGAILVAGIVAMLSGFVAEQMTEAHELDHDAVPIEGAVIEASASSGKAAGPEPILGMIAGADVAKGQKLSKACAACHSFDKGGPNKVGPNLWGTVLGPKAGVGDFAYSDSLKNMGGAWSYEELNAFLWKPKKFLPGTKMSYVGLKKAKDRAALIAWLRTMADSPAALPSDEEIAKEQADLGSDEAGAPQEH